MFENNHQHHTIPYNNLLQRDYYDFSTSVYGHVAIDFCMVQHDVGDIF